MSRNGELLFERAWGMANLERGEPLRPASLFCVGSLAKQFTAAAVALLAVSGELDLDADIRTWFPELHYEERITVRQLIHHTGGIRDYIELMKLVEYRPGSSSGEQIGLELLARQRTLNFSPGEDHLYSNSGYLLLGELVRRVSGRSLREFLKEELFDPLGMSHSSFLGDDRDMKEHWVSGYRLESDGSYRQDPRTLFGVATGSGGMIATAGDLLRWSDSLMAPQAGGRELTKLLLTRGKLNDGHELRYAFGLVHGRYRGAAIVGHGGTLGGFRSALTLIPEHRLSVAVLCNAAHSNPDGYARRIVDIILADELGNETVVTIEPEVLDDYVGRYHAGDDVITVSHDGATLAAGGSGGRWSPMQPLSDDRFRVLAIDQVAQFERAADGRVVAMTLDPDGVPRRATRLEGFQTTAEALLEYEGEYASDELQVSYWIASGGGRLLLRVGDRECGALEAVKADSLLSTLGELAFERDDRGSIIGFRLNGARAKGLAFRKR